VTYQQHEILDDGAVLLAVTENGTTVGYVFRDGKWHGKDFATVREASKIRKLGELFAEGRARQSIDRALDL
jgi:hypothetical protein